MKLIFVLLAVAYAQEAQEAQPQSQPQGAPAQWGQQALWGAQGNPWASSTQWGQPQGAQAQWGQAQAQAQGAPPQWAQAQGQQWGQLGSFNWPNAAQFPPQFGQAAAGSANEGFNQGANQAFLGQPQFQQQEFNLEQYKGLSGEADFSKLQEESKKQFAALKAQQEEAALKFEELKAQAAKAQSEFQAKVQSSRLEFAKQQNAAEAGASATAGAEGGQQFQGQFPTFQGPSHEDIVDVDELTKDLLSKARSPFSLRSDAHDMCNEWSQTGECKKNPAYMLSHCGGSCAKLGLISPFYRGLFNEPAHTAPVNAPFDAAVQGALDGSFGAFGAYPQGQGQIGFGYPDPSLQESNPHLAQSLPQPQQAGAAQAGPEWNANEWNENVASQWGGDFANSFAGFPNAYPYKAQRGQ